MSAAIQNEMERLRADRDGMKRQLDEALEREAGLAVLLGRHSMCAGHAEQRRAESRAVRKALGFGEDADDVSPQDLLSALARRDLIKQAEVLEEFADNANPGCEAQDAIVRQAYYDAETLMEQAKVL